MVWGALFCNWRKHYGDIAAVIRNIFVLADIIRVPLWGHSFYWEHKKGVVLCTDKHYKCVE